MQEMQFVANMPSLLITGFLIGFILIIIGYREVRDLSRRNHLIGIGIGIVGIMIPVTPLSWYIYWVGLPGLLALELVHKAVIGLAILVGVVVIFQGARVYGRPQ
jgi:hypothetical protein